MRFLRRLPTTGLARSREAAIIELVRGKDVLHVGAADAGFVEHRAASRSLLHEMLQDVASHVVGLDSDEEAVAYWRARGVRDLQVGDAEHLDETTVAWNMDVVLAADVLEHLDNPGLFLDGLREHMPQDSRLVLTTPNGLWWKGLPLALLGYELIHPDHVAVFTPNSVRALVTKHGFSVERLIYYPIPLRLNPQSHTGFYYPSLARVLTGVDAMVRSAVLPVAPQVADGLCVVCSRARS